MQRHLVFQTFSGPYHVQFKSISISAKDTIRNISLIILETVNTALPESSYVSCSLSKPVKETLGQLALSRIISIYTC